MKSIGNGWKRAQEAMANAKKREGDYILRECVVNHNIQPLLDRAMGQSTGAGWKRAQEAQQRKKDAERVREYWADNAQTTATPFRPLSALLGTGYQAPPQNKLATLQLAALMNAGRRPKTIWQRIKRALRAL